MGVFRVHLLCSCARCWVVSASPVQAAAIVILGGSLDSRPFAAAKLYKAGFAPIILIPEVKSSPTQDMGLTLSDSEVAFRVLLREGIPASAIQRIGRDVTSTFEECQAVKNWTEAQPKQEKITLLVPTEEFHTRRTNWIFHKILPNNIQSCVVNIPHAEFTLQDWWQHEEGLITFQNEVVKTCYYFWKY